MPEVVLVFPPVEGIRNEKHFDSQPVTRAQWDASIRRADAALLRWEQLYRERGEVIPDLQGMIVELGG